MDRLPVACRRGAGAVQALKLALNNPPPAVSGRGGRRRERPGTFTGDLKPWLSPGAEPRLAPAAETARPIDAARRHVNCRSWPDRRRWGALDEGPSGCD